jgi:hypothetical protein
LSTASAHTVIGSVSAAISTGMLDGTPTQFSAGTRTSAASAPSRVTPIPLRWVHRSLSPARQAAHCPHTTEGRTATRVPCTSPFTPGPTAATVPANSWPMVTGIAWRMIS